MQGLRRSFSWRLTRSLQSSRVKSQLRLSMKRHVFLERLGVPDERMRALSCREQTFSSTCNVEASQERFCVLCGRSWNDFASFEPSRTSFSKHVLTLRRPIDEFARVPSTLFQACSNVEACQGRVCERCGATESGTSAQINRNQRRSAGLNATQARFGSGRTKFLSKGLSIGLVLL